MRTRGSLACRPKVPEMTRSTVLLPLLLGLLACNGCHDSAPPANAAVTTTGAATNVSGDPDAAPLAAAGTTTIHVEDDGKSFDLARGASVAFSLPSNAGTGYVWVPTKIDAGILSQQGDRTSDVSSDVPGAPKVDVYHFVGASPGTSVVEMSLKRPFGSAPPARIIHVTVNVR